MTPSGSPSPPVPDPVIVVGKILCWLAIGLSVAGMVGIVAFFVWCARG